MQQQVLDDSVSLAIEKLRLADGDFLVFTLPEGVIHSVENVTLMQRALKRMVDPLDVRSIVLPHGATLRHLQKEDVERLRARLVHVLSLEGESR